MEPHLNHPFELLFDLTRGGAHCEIPVHWLNQFFQLVFTEMNDHLVYLHLFNPNFHLQRYIRKFPRILTNKLVKRTRSAISISELSNSIALSEIRLPKDSCKLCIPFYNRFINWYICFHLKMTLKKKWEWLLQMLSWLPASRHIYLLA